jgi:hypothetical protein
MAQPFRVIDGDAPESDRGGWDENGNVDLPGVLTVNTVKGSGSSTPGLTTVQFLAKVVFNALTTFVNSILQLSADTTTTDVFAIFVTGDTTDRFRSDATGKFRWGPGNAARDTNLYRSNVGELRTDTFFIAGGGAQSNAEFTAYTGASKALIAGTAGGGLAVAEGSNARMGRATLVGGTVVVANTSVTANTEIFLTCNTSAGTPGFLRVSARTPGTSFTILSSSGTDTSVVSYLLVEPA